MCALIGLGLSFDCGCPWICTARVVTVLTPDCGLVRSMARSELGEDVSEDELQAMIAEFDSTKTGRSESRPTSSSSFLVTQSTPLLTHIVLPQPSTIAVSETDFRSIMESDY